MIKPKKTLQNIEPYSIDKYYQEYKLKLDSNENSYGPSPLVIETLKNLSVDKIKFYPAYGELLDKMSKVLNCEIDNLLFTNGCDEAINSVLSAYLEDTDKVLSYGPTFSMPKLYCDCIGAEFIEIPYKETFNFDYDYYVSNIKDDIKILYLTCPNNPTGEIVKLDIIEKLLQNYKDKLLVLDCTYFNYSNISQSDYFDLVKKYDNLVIVKSFSKDYALAGLRLGYIYSNKNIISEIKKIVSPYSVNSMALHAGISALGDIEYFKRLKDKFKKSKEKLEDALVSFGYKVYKTETNFVLCNFGLHSDFIYQKLLNNGVKVKYFKNVPFLENTFRITIPKLDDVDYLVSLIKPRPLFVFDMDGVIYDVKNSYREAIKKTVKYYTGEECTDLDIQSVKNMGNMSNDWDVSEYLIKKTGKNINYNEMVDIFQDFFFVKDRNPAGLIDNEKNVLDEKFYIKLNKYADCAIFTGRPKQEAFHSLKRDNLLKYFSYFVCNEDVEGNYKPSPYGLEKIKKCCPHSEIYYFGDTVDDIKAGVDADIVSYGIIPPFATHIEDTKKCLFEYGAKGVFESKDEILSKLVDEEMYANS